MINSLNELSDIYLGTINEADNSPEAVKARVMQHVRAIRYRARKEGETLNKAYNEFMGSQSGVTTTEKQMVKERLGLTGGAAHVGEETSLADIRKASNLSTSDNPADQDEARRIKTEMDYESLIKQRGKRVKKESHHVNWRSELREINDADPVTEKEADKKVVEKKITNKITINPTQSQAESFAKTLGGEVLELYEVEEKEPEDDITGAAGGDDKKAKAQADREKRMKVRLLRLKMMGARQGVEGIVAHHEPEGDVISEKQKDTPDQVKAVIAYDKARKATDDATYDTEHGDKKQAKKEKDYAKWQRDTGARDAQKSGHPWKHAKGSTREKEGKKSVKHAHVKDSYDPLEIQDANGNTAYHIVDVIKAPTGLKAAQPIPALAELSEETIRESIDEATLHFFHEGINEDGLDLIIEEVGLEDFTDYVLCGPDILEEARPAKRANVRNLQALRKKVKTDAEAEAKRKAQKKGEYKEAPKKKPRLGAPTYTTTVSKVKKATAAAKQKQSDKKPNRVGLLGKIRGAVKKVGDSSFGQGVKAVGKFAKDVDSVLKVNKKTTVNMQSYEPEGEVIAEKDLNAAERRALPDKEFALPGKGKGPEGKQAGSYPIPDKNHARMALAMVAKHGTPAKQAKVRAAVKKKFPDIQQEAVDSATPRTADEKKKMAKMKALLDRMQALKVAAAKKAKGDVTESDAAFTKVAGDLKKKYGSGVLVGKEKPPAPTEEEKKKASAERKKRQDADNKAFASRAKKAGYKNPQDYANVVARYGSEDNYNKGKGLGT